MPVSKSIDFSEPPSERVPVLDHGTLRRILSSRHLFAIGYGDVGCCVYYALGVTALYALGAVHAIKIPPSLPLEAQIKPARFAGETIVELVQEGGYDLSVLNVRQRILSAAPGCSSFGTTIECVVKNAPCPVCLLRGRPS